MNYDDSIIFLCRTSLLKDVIKHLPKEYRDYVQKCRLDAMETVLYDGGPGSGPPLGNQNARKYPEGHEANKERSRSAKVGGKTSLRYARRGSPENGGNSLGAHLDENGKLTKEREALHKEIINKQFEGAKKPEGQHVFTMLGGGPAAGKSTIEASGILPEDTVTVAADKYKSELPEYAQMRSSQVDGAKAASYVHEESTALADRSLSHGIKNGYNTCLDGTGDHTVQTVLHKINMARKAGAKVNGVYVTCDVETAVRRSAERQVREGRGVPEDVIRQKHSAVSRILPQVADKFDNVELYDTENGGHVLIATGGSGKGLTPVRGQEARYQRFLEKARMTRGRRRRS